MSTKFDHILEYEYEGDFNEFVNNKINYGEKHDPPVPTEVIVPEHKYKKIISTNITLLGTHLLSMAGYGKIVVEQYITVKDNYILCEMKPINEYSKYLDFNEEYLCTNNNGVLNIKIKIYGENHCPSLFKTTVEDAYINQRKSRVEYEISKTKNVDEIYITNDDNYDSDDIIQ